MLTLAFSKQINNFVNNCSFQQVQVATQTQPSVTGGVTGTGILKKKTSSKFGKKFFKFYVDMNIGVCPVSSQQQDQQPSLANTKIPAGVAKKAIDKASRKERNRYSLLRQTPTGSQGKLYL